MRSLRPALESFGMPWSDTHAALAMIGAFATGCALHLVNRPGGGPMPPLSFWPPPRSTSIWVADSSSNRPEVTFAEVAGKVARALRDAGYEDEHWYPIGLNWAHGFALTTRLERIQDDGSPRPGRERWSPVYADPASLRWLDAARKMRLPGPGRYRVLLFVFTDLPIEASNRAPVWNEATFMAGPNAPLEPFPAKRRAPLAFRLAAYIYEYTSSSRDGEGTFLARDADISPARHIEMSGISVLTGFASDVR